MNSVSTLYDNHELPFVLMESVLMSYWFPSAIFQLTAFFTSGFTPSLILISQLYQNREVNIGESMLTSLSKAEVDVVAWMQLIEILFVLQIY